MASVEKKKRVRGNNPNKEPPKPPQPLIPRTPESIARMTCELCGFQPISNNRWQLRQDHIARVHFMDKIEAAFGGSLSKNCPAEGCTFTAKDKRDCMRHYANSHKMVDKWMREALAARGLTYNPSYKRRKPGEPKKVPRSRITFVFNKPSNITSFPCSKCNQKFEDRSHLIAHNKYIHLKYGDDNRKWLDDHRCDICGKLFVEKKYVKTHKANVHMKEKLSLPCQICKKVLGSKRALTFHMRKHEKDAPAAEPSTSTINVLKPSTSKGAQGTS